MFKMSAWVGIQERGGPEVLPGLPQSILEQTEGKGEKGMTYEAHITITLNWNIDKRLLLRKTFSFNTYNEAAEFFTSRGIPLNDEVHPWHRHRIHWDVKRAKNGIIIVRYMEFLMCL